MFYFFPQIQLLCMYHENYVLKVKNAMVKSVHYVMEYTTCSLVTLFHTILGD